jgi:hypothetical protein
MLLVRQYGDQRMTNPGDVVRQIEKTLCDQQNPPTTDQKEKLTRILYAVYAVTVEFKGSK